jgi:hypothetical protein
LQTESHCLKRKIKKKRGKDRVNQSSTGLVPDILVCLTFSIMKMKTGRMTQK